MSEVGTVEWELIGQTWAELDEMAVESATLELSTTFSSLLRRRPNLNQNLGIQQLDRSPRNCQQ